MAWTIWWDTRRRGEDERWNEAGADTEAGAIERAAHFLRLHLIVHAIWKPDGTLFMDEAQIVERFGIKHTDGAVPEDG